MKYNVFIISVGTQETQVYCLNMGRIGCLQLQAHYSGRGFGCSAVFFNGPFIFFTWVICLILIIWLALFNPSCLFFFSFSPSGSVLHELVTCVYLVMNSSSLDTTLKPDISEGFTVRFQDFFNIFYGFLRLRVALYMRCDLLCEWQHRCLVMALDFQWWGFCGWYPQMDVVGERTMEADRRLSNGLSVISCWVSGPGSTLWVWASGAGTPQDMERSPSAAWWVCAVWHCSSETQKPNVQVSCYWLW